MRSVATDPMLAELLERVEGHARSFGRVLPEMRFFILDGLEFASLLEKHVYPTSPTNIWEGKRMVHKKRRIEVGLESAVYYEVVQTGNPSYAYLNSDNNPVTQASVMAHVVGHCEFSEINVLKDSDQDRTEYVMYLVNKVDVARRRMGARDYQSYWNACESASTLIAPLSQYSLTNSIDTEFAMDRGFAEESEPEKPGDKVFQPVFATLDSLLEPTSGSGSLARDLQKRKRRETLNRKGYALKAPCEDVLGFLRHYAPTSNAERAILDYIYVSRAPRDFVARTQVMNEGWAMYWEKRIMHELFREKAVAGIIDYARVFSAVCYPRPYFQRNPYHLGYNLWCHIEKLYRDGKVSLAYAEEVDREKRNDWKVDDGCDPVEAMVHLVKTVTDYEFLRRFLTPQLVHDLHLNRIDRTTAAYLNVKDNDVFDADEHWIWLDPKQVKREMLGLYEDFHRPRIYVIDDDFDDGGLLLYHRHDGRQLRESWIKPTLKNINLVWKGSVSLISGTGLHRYRSQRYQQAEIEPISFEEVVERIQAGEEPIRDA